MTSFYIQSDNGNCYHFNHNAGVLSLISPIVFKINTLIEKGYDRLSIYTKLSIENELSSNEIESYLNQYSFWEKSVSQNEKAEKHKLKLTPDLIKTTLSNLKQITFEVTDACNLKCKYCGYGEFYQNYDIRLSKDLSISQARKIIEYLSSYWNGSENLSEGEILYVSFYGGEPLLNMSLIKEIVHIFNSINIRRPIYYSMTTNAILLKKHIDYLLAHDFHLLISLDGNKENNSFRTSANGKESFDTIYESMKYIQKKHPSFFKKNIEFNAVLHSRNSVKEIIDFFNNEFEKTPSIGELNSNGVRKETEKEFNTIYKNKAQDINKSLRTTRNLEKDQNPLFHFLTTFIQSHNATTYTDYNTLFNSNIELNRLPTGTCIPFSKKLFITVNGKILPCERIGQKYSLGTVTDQNIEIDLDEICERYNKWLRPTSKRCQTCYMRYACQQCIFNFPNINKPFCLDYMNKIEFTSFLKRAIDYLERNPQSYHNIMKNILIR